MGPKLFWTVQIILDRPNNFGREPIVLDRSNYFWSGPNQFGLVQIMKISPEKSKFKPTKMIWTRIPIKTIWTQLNNLDPNPDQNNLDPTK